MQQNELKSEAAQASIANNAPVLKRKKDARATVKTLAMAAAANVQAASGSDPLPLGKLKAVRLEDIVIEDRPRQDLGDLKGLARSLAESGLVQPPLLDAQMRLVSGHRRVEAARLLGWKEMPARILDIEDPIALTVAEDANRKPLNASEKYAVCLTLRRRAKAEGWRKSAFGGRLDEAAEKGRLDEAIAKAVGLSRESLRKISAIHSAEADLAKFGSLVERLDADGKVDRWYRELEAMKGRGDARFAAAIVVAPNRRDLYEVAEAKDVARFVKDSLLAAGSDEGTVLLFSSSVETLGEAVGLVRQGGFDWRTTLRGSGAPGEGLWLVGVLGRRRKSPLWLSSCSWKDAAKARTLPFRPQRRRSTARRARWISRNSQQRSRDPLCSVPMKGRSGLLLPSRIHPH